MGKRTPPDLAVHVRRALGAVAIVQLNAELGVLRCKYTTCNVQRATSNMQRAMCAWRCVCVCVCVCVWVCACVRAFLWRRGGTSESISCQNVESADPRSPRYKHRLSSVTCRATLAGTLFREQTPPSRVCLAAQRSANPRDPLWRPTVLAPLVLRQSPMHSSAATQTCGRAKQQATQQRCNAQ